MVKSLCTGREWKKNRNQNDDDQDADHLHHRHRNCCEREKRKKNYQNLMIKIKYFNQSMKKIKESKIWRERESELDLNWIEFLFSKLQPNTSSMIELEWKNSHYPITITITIIFSIFQGLMFGETNRIEMWRAKSTELNHLPSPPPLYQIKSIYCF